MYELYDYKKDETEKYILMNLT